MLAEAYEYLLLLCSAALFFFSMVLILGHLPEGELYSGYARGKILYGIAGFIMGMGFFLIWTIDRDRANDLEDAAIYLSACFIAAIPYWVANLYMLAVGKKRKENKLFLLTIPLFLGLLWGGIYLPNRPLGRLMIILACTMLVLMTLHFIRRIYAGYKVSTKMMESYYSGEVNKRIHWIERSSQIMALTIIAMIPVVFYLQKYISIALIGLIGLSIYLYLCISNYFANFQTLINVREENSQNIKKLGAESNETYRQISKKVAEWKLNGGPFRKDISLDMVAAELTTNRTYLSNYINEVQGTSFRDWISGLKIEKAKELILNNPEMSINDIADAVGSSSQSFFARKFKEVVGQTPTEYRKLYSS